MANLAEQFSGVNLNLFLCKEDTMWYGHRIGGDADPYIRGFCREQAPSCSAGDRRGRRSLLAKLLCASVPSACPM